MTFFIWIFVTFGYVILMAVKEQSMNIQTNSAIEQYVKSYTGE